jgi:hypothetical protein
MYISSKVCLCHTLSRDFSDYRRGPGLMIEFIEPFDRARDYILHLTVTHTLVYTFKS